MVRAVSAGGRAKYSRSRVVLLPRERLAVIGDLFNFELVGNVREPGRQAAVLVLLSFLCSFAFIRTSARLTRSVSWWPGSVVSGDVHLHHLVWGIVLLLVSGFTAFATELESPWWQMTAIGFGIGAGLTLDEFALWVHLEDVYWSDEGRASLDAVVMAAVFAGLVVVGAQPWGLTDSGSMAGTALLVILDVGLAGLTFLKGRLLLAVLALFMLPAGVWGAYRLGKPSSPIGRRYDEPKRARAQRRFRPDRPAARFTSWFFDTIGGKPTLHEAAPQREETR